MTSNKADILEFCDSIQDLVSTMNEETKAPSTSDLACVQLSLESSQLNRMEIAESEQSELSCGEGPSRGVIPKRGRGRPRKNATRIPSMASIQENSSDYEFMRQVDNSSRSSWSDQ